MSRASSFIAAEPGGLPFEVIPRAVGWYRADDGLNNLGAFGAALDLAEIGGPVPTVVGVDGRAAWRFEKAVGNYLGTVLGYEQFQPFNVIAVFRYHTAPVDNDTAFGAGTVSTRVRAVGGALRLFAGADVTQAATLTDWNALDWFSQADIGGHRLAQNSAIYTPYPMPLAGNDFSWNNMALGASSAGVVSDVEIAEFAILDGAATIEELQIIWAYFRRRFPSMGLLTPSTSFTDLSLGLPSLVGKKAFLLMGQSNCEGRAASGAEAFDGVNTFAVYLDGSYALATHPLSDDTLNIDPVYINNGLAAESCWSAFANWIQPTLGTDIVLAPCSRGSTSSTEWRPDASTSGLTRTRASLFGAALYRAQQLVAAGADLTCVYYQDEEEILGGVDNYEQNVTDIIAAMRAELGFEVPFIVVKYGWQGANVTNELATFAAQDAIAASVSAVSLTGATWGFAVHYDGPESITVGREIGSIVIGPRSNVDILADSVWGLDMYDPGTYTEVAGTVTALANARTGVPMTIVGTPQFDNTLNAGPCLHAVALTDYFLSSEAAVVAALVDQRQCLFMAVYELTDPDQLRPLFGWGNSAVDTNGSGYVGRNSVTNGHLSITITTDAGVTYNRVAVPDADTNPHVVAWRWGAQKWLLDVDGAVIDVGGGAPGLPATMIGGTVTPDRFGIWVRPDSVPTLVPVPESLAKTSAQRLWPYILPANERAAMLSYLQTLSGL